jgi:hypothetical protein
MGKAKARRTTRRCLTSRKIDKAGNIPKDGYDIEVASKRGCVKILAIGDVVATTIRK